MFLKALESSLGNVLAAEKKTGINRASHYRWMRETVARGKSYSERVDEISEQQKDFVESKLFELIRGTKAKAKTPSGDEIIYTRQSCKTSVIFFLKTRAKERGYVEGLELTGRSGGPIEYRDIDEVQIQANDPEDDGDDE